MRKVTLKSTALKSTSLLISALFLTSCAHSPKPTQATVAIDYSAKIKAIDPSYEHVTDQYADIFRTVDALKKTCDTRLVLVTLDIDNTTLVNDDELGSEQWFDWQVGLLKDESEDAVSQRLANNFTDLLKADLKIRQQSKMHLIEKDLDQQIQKRQKAQVTFMALTSRGPDNKSATLREFRRNRLNFSKPAISGGKEAMQRFPKAEMVDFQDNLFFTSGQNKGQMLKTLLTETKTKPCAVVFVDNKEKYSEQVNAAMADQDVITATFRYSREDAAMEAFVKKDKAKLVQAWKKLK